MAAEFIPANELSDEAPLLDPAGYCGVAILRNQAASDALHAWCMLKLTRLNLAAGYLPEASQSIAFLGGFALYATPSVAALIHRDLVGLNAALAVARAVCPVSLA